MTYLERIAQRKAAYKVATPPRLIPTPPKIYQILNCKLEPIHRQAWIVPVQCSEFTNAPIAITHIAYIKQCGRPLQQTRHLISFFCSPPGAKILSDTLDTTPLFQLYSRPFIFHDKQKAIDEIKHTLHTQL